MTKYALEIEQLNKTYRNGVKALKNINLNVEDGDLFAFLGPNGAPFGPRNANKSPSSTLRFMFFSAFTPFL